ncbi:MAG: hypothetical protein EOM67_09020 [Spirochaetia bacterium]|nr:hypothetical protein [Spirochaetia bacterium]
MRVTYTIIITIMISLFMIVPLYSNSLLFETSSGTITDFDLTDNNNDGKNPTVSPSSISGYGGSSEYWSYDGFVGRLAYLGDPNTITVDNIGPTAFATSNPPRFYYTRMNWYSGVSDPDAWREIFFTARVKARDHNNGTVNLNNNKNYVIENPGDTFSVPGAGEELVTSGPAYNESGTYGTYNASTGFIYKYQYKILWIDFTAIRTTNNRNLSGNQNKGYYESYVRVKGDGVYQVLSLEGFYDPFPNDENPDAYSFSIERLAPDIIPFTELITRTSRQNSYLAGHVRFHSTETTGSVGFYANSSGTSTNFFFSATVAGNQISFPYSVAFDPVFCGNKNSSSTVSSSNNSFTTKVATVNSIIDNQSSTENVLTGDIRIFVNTGITINTYPAAEYSSIIYAIVTTN